MVDSVMPEKYKFFSVKIEKETSLHGSRYVTSTVTNNNQDIDQFSFENVCVLRFEYSPLIAVSRRWSPRTLFNINDCFIGSVPLPKIGGSCYPNVAIMKKNAPSGKLSTGDRGQ
jgi:hypothetical protein